MKKLLKKLLKKHKYEVIYTIEKYKKGYVLKMYITSYTRLKVYNEFRKCHKKFGTNVIKIRKVN